MLYKVRVVPHSFPLASATSQRVLGLLLAGLIAAAWLGVHFFAMLAFELSWAAWPQVLVIAALQCWLSVGVFIVAHDAMHGSLAPGWHRLNSAIGAALLFLYAGFAWRKVRDAHFSHHAHTGKDGDPDFDTAHPAQFWPWYWTFFKRYFGWQSLVYVHTVVAIYFFVFEVPFLQLCLLYGAPALLSSLQLFYFGTYRPHRHGAGEFADGHNARSDNFSTLASLASCFHFGYHLEHHRRPDVPWWALPKARRAGVGE